MLELSFDWDDRKNRSNERKHGITFEEAATVFYDESALLMADPEHSEDEERFLIQGYSARRRLLVVVHCYRESPAVIRIISARPSTLRDRSQYEGFQT